MAIKQVRNFLRRPGKIGLVLAVIILLAAGGYWRFMHKTVRIVHLPPQPEAAAIKNSPQNASGAQAPQKVTNPKGGSTAAATPNNVTPPAGSFVSNHKPNSTNDQEQSLCNTTIGAMCTVSFTKGTSVIKLEARQTDSSGAVAWDWTPSQLGLSSGAWSVSATATAGSKSATTTDPIPLEIP